MFKILADIAIEVKISQMWGLSVGICIFYNILKLSCFVSELLEKDISNVVIQCG
jgi:hypothetical protein